MLDEFFLQTLVVAGQLEIVGSALFALGRVTVFIVLHGSTGSDLGHDELESAPVFAQVAHRVVGRKKPAPVAAVEGASGKRTGTVGLLVGFLVNDVYETRRARWLLRRRRRWW